MNEEGMTTKNWKKKCQLCGEMKFITEHHIIHQNLNLTYSLLNPQLTFTEVMIRKNGGHVSKKINHYISLNIPLIKIMLELCTTCHEKLHPENKLYNKIESLQKENRGLKDNSLEKSNISLEKRLRKATDTLLNMKNQIETLNKKNKVLKLRLKGKEVLKR